MNVLLVLAALLLSAAQLGCGTAPDALPGPAGESEDIVMTAADFECLHGGVRVGRVTVWNKRGHLDEALAVAESDEPGTYPVGTVLQLVPQEAMVKRAPGYSPSTNDWEFFQLGTSADGTEIIDRGPSARGVFGACMGCHGQAPAEYDFTCGKTQSEPCGYDENQHPLFDWLVDNDARCPG